MNIKIEGYGITLEVNSAGPFTETQRAMIDLALKAAEPKKEATYRLVFVRAGETTGAYRIAAIKAIRTITGMGLKEAKDIVEYNGETILVGGRVDQAIKTYANMLLEAGAIYRIEPE